MSNEDVVTPEPPKSASNPWKMISMFLVVLVLVAGAGGAGFWWSQRNVTAEGKAGGASAAATPAAAPAVGKGIVTFQPFLANLADPGGNRFLRASIQLVVPEASQGDAITKDDVMQMRLRSAILEILTEQKADQLVTPEGKAQLKKAIKDRATAILGTVPVVDVLFSDFVVQF